MRRRKRSRIARVRIQRRRQPQRRIMWNTTRRIYDPNLPVEHMEPDVRVDVEALDELNAYWRDKLEKIEDLKARLSTPHVVLQILKQDSGS